MPASWNTPADSADSAMAIRMCGASAPIAYDGTRRLAEAAEILRDAEVDQDARMQDAKAGIGRERRGSRERPAGCEHVVHQDEAPLAPLHLEHARAVLQPVLALDDGRREL